MARSSLGPEARKLGGTKIQLKLNAQIAKLGFNTELEYPFPPYQVDIYVPEIHVAFEADGQQHRVKADRERDEALLLNYGLVVFRFSQKEIEDGVDEERLVSIIEDSAIDKTERIKAWQG